MHVHKSAIAEPSSIVLMEHGMDQNTNKNFWMGIMDDLFPLFFFLSYVLQINCHKTCIVFQPWNQNFVS